jgi:hypothetical protein
MRWETCRWNDRNGNFFGTLLEEVEVIATGRDTGAPMIWSLANVHEAPPMTRKGEDYLCPNSRDDRGQGTTAMEAKATFPLVRTGFLDDPGVRWTPWNS